MKSSILKTLLMINNVNKEIIAGVNKSAPFCKIITVNDRLYRQLQSSNYINWWYKRSFTVFSSKMNLIEMIIIKTHLNPNKKQYHNCGIIDVHSGYGFLLH